MARLLYSRDPEASYSFLEATVVTGLEATVVTASESSYFIQVASDANNSTVEVVKPPLCGKLIYSRASETTYSILEAAAVICFTLGPLRPPELSK